MRSFLVLVNLMILQSSLTSGFVILKKMNSNPVQASLPFANCGTALTSDSALHSMPSANSGTELTEPGASVASKFFQLEEREDKDSSTTELFLSNDGTIALSESDGPPPVRATGTWSQQGNELKMTVTRTFNAGQPGNDMGEFLFDVKRSYTGYLESVGDLVSVSGSMHVPVSSIFFHICPHRSCNYLVFE